VVGFLATVKTLVKDNKAGVVVMLSRVIDSSLSEELLTISSKSS